MEKKAKFTNRKKTGKGVDLGGINFANGTNDFGNHDCSFVECCFSRARICTGMKIQSTTDLSEFTFKPMLFQHYAGLLHLLNAWWKWTKVSSTGLVRNKIFPIHHQKITQAIKRTLEAIFRIGVSYDVNEASELNSVLSLKILQDTVRPGCDVEIKLNKFVVEKYRCYHQLLPCTRYSSIRHCLLRRRSVTIHHGRIELS